MLIQFKNVTIEGIEVFFQCVTKGRLTREIQRNSMGQNFIHYQNIKTASIYIKLLKGDTDVMWVIRGVVWQHARRVGVVVIRKFTHHPPVAPLVRLKNVNVLHPLCQLTALCSTHSTQSCVVDTRYHDTLKKLTNTPRL